VAPAVVMILEFNAALLAVELNRNFVRGLKLIQIVADDRAILAARDNGYGVFDFDSCEHLMISFAKEGGGGAGDPFEQVHHVSHRILNRATALRVIAVVDFAVSRAKSWEMLSRNRRGRAHGTKGTAIQEGFDGTGFVTAVIDVGDVAGATTCLMGGLELVDSIERKGERFFEKAVLSCSQDLCADGDMTSRRGADDDGVAGWIGHCLLPIRGGLHLIFFRHIGEDCRSGIAGDDSAAACFFEVAQVAFTDATAADNKNRMHGEIFRVDDCA